jgi:hypothetical protein
MSVRILLVTVVIMALAMLANSFHAKKARLPLVRELRRVAGLASVAACRDDSGKGKVTGMMMDIRAASDLEAAVLQAAEETFQRYECTFSTDTGPKQLEGFRLRGKSFLLTYNWDYFNKPFPDGTPPPSTPAELWGMWVSWKHARARLLGVRQSTSTLEASLHSDIEGRVHLHWKVNLGGALDQTNTDGLDFLGVQPDARATTVPTDSFRKNARGANFLEASNRAHFYVWAPKEGTLRGDTDYIPFQAYRVLGKWLDDLWTDRKLSNKTYEALSLQVRVGHAGRMRDLQLVAAREKEGKVDQQLAKVEAELAKLRAPFRVFPEVRAWEDSFLNLDFRWKLLVLVADSASGKSSFAESLFERPFILTVEAAEHLDLKAFEQEVNDGLVLDNVNSWEQLLRWRAVLQARNAKSSGGQSATNMFAYVQYLFGVAVVATIDLDAPDAYLVQAGNPKCSNWLLKNCVILRLPAGQAFYDREAVPQAVVENTFSRFADTVKRRRLAQ